jgi:hypothetical protein
VGTETASSCAQDCFRKSSNYLAAKIDFDYDQVIGEPKGALNLVIFSLAGLLFIIGCFVAMFVFLQCLATKK